MSIATVYNAQIRNNGTANRCTRAIRQELGFNKRDSEGKWIDCPRYEPHGELPKHDLYIYVDDGRDELEWTCPGPSAYWAIDTHLGYDYRLSKARQFDRVYTAQKAGAERMRADGIKHVEWLPLACSPSLDPCLGEMRTHPNRAEIAGEFQLAKRHDLVFVGYMNRGAGENSHNRVEFLDEIFRDFPNFWCSANTFHEHQAVRYIRSRIGLNISIKNDLNMRFFEVLSTGTALLTNTDVDGIEDIGFEEGKHFIGYTDVEDAKDKARYYLEHEDEREEIAAAGHELVRANHTYAHRMAYILDSFGIPKAEAA